MGTLTGAQIELDIRTMLPEATSERIQSQQILRLTNAAYIDDLAIRLNIPELDATGTQNTVASTATVTFAATDVLIIKNVCITDSGLPLKEIDADEYTRMLGRSGDYTGEPAYYYRTGTATSGQVTLRLFPTPDAVYGLTLNYQKRPTALTVSTATAIDSRFDEALLYLAAARVCMLLRLLKEAKEIRGYAEGLLSSLAPLTAGASVVPVPFYGANLTKVMR